MEAEINLSGMILGLCMLGLGILIIILLRNPRLARKVVPSLKHSDQRFQGHLPSLAWAYLMLGGAVLVNAIKAVLPIAVSSSQWIFRGFLIVAGLLLLHGVVQVIKEWRHSRSNTL